MMRLLLAIILSLPLWAAAQDPMSPYVAQRLMLILEESEESPETALEELSELAALRRLDQTERGYVLRERTSLLVRLDRHEQARQELLAALADPASGYVPALRVLLAQLLLMDNNSGEAMAQLEIWSGEVSNPHPGELSLLGYAYVQNERYDEGAEVFERLISESETDNINNQWIEILAYTYTRIGRSDDAVRLIEETIAAQPAAARWWRQLSSIFLVMENVESGTSSLAIASLLEDMNFEDKRRLSLLFNMLNLPREGAQILELALASHSEEADFDDRMLLGELWVLARETDRAIAEFERAALLSDTGEPALKIGQLQLQWERYQQARNSLRLAIDAYGEETPEQLYYLLAVTEINLDNFEAASEAIGRLEEDGPYGDRARNLDQFIQNQLLQQ